MVICPNPRQHCSEVSATSTVLASGLLLWALFFCLSALVVLSVWRQRKACSSLPPGPTPLPFIGNYLQLNTEQMYDSFMKIGEKFGPVFTVHLGPRTVVVLTGFEAVKEALVDQAEEFSGRGEQATFDWLFKGFALSGPQSWLNICSNPSQHCSKASATSTMLASGLLLGSLLLSLSALVVLSVWRQRKASSGLPPGPTPLPFIGNYLQLNTEQMYDSLMKPRLERPLKIAWDVGDRP
ncbi:cytochrome P450 1A4-like [Vombatus ursinus]|uniref:cytochrome P450 1A4-like n=1 Tax=Vombatus ursinus TaxID=29139 RepID=UPI000FFD5B41|nr:cytochrome P450 1A4-like [Vombatus ursinus]